MKQSAAAAGGTLLLLLLLQQQQKKTEREYKVSLGIQGFLINVPFEPALYTLSRDFIHNSGFQDPSSHETLSK